MTAKYLDTLNFLFRIILSLLFISISAQQLITPIPLTVDYSKEKAELGRLLFSDPILSVDSTISCATCHHLNSGGDDGLPFSIGVHQQVGTINAPTVFNSAHNFVQFWDGRASDLKEQARGPIQNPIEMGHNFDKPLHRLKKSFYYRQLFKRTYPDRLTEANIVDALAEFEKALDTPNSRFDKYLRGDNNALTPSEIEGFTLFKSLGCISCHNGVLLGGNMYQKFGVMKAYSDSTNQLGRFNVTGRLTDKRVFKVPMLRNIAQTAPYFHDGSTASLLDAVKIMSEYQLGKPIRDDEVKSIVAFLISLTGETPDILK